MQHTLMACRERKCGAAASAGLARPGLEGRTKKCQGGFMRIESSVTSISWIPSEAVAGVTRIPFEAGVSHYDDPPPDQWADLDSLLGPEGARFANDLRAWIEVQDGTITGYGQTGAGRVSNTLIRLAGMRVQVEAVVYPELRPEPVVGADFVRFTGSRMKLTTRHPVNNNRHFEGRLESFQDGRLTLDLSVASKKSRKKMGAAAEQGQRMEIEFANIEKANLVPEI